MPRAILGVIVGYVVLALVIMGSFAGAYAMLGPDTVFLPESYEPSATWLAFSISIGLVAALVGGFVCATIAGRRKPAVVLAALLLVLGLVSAAFVGLAPTDPPETRGADVGRLEAAEKAHRPLWIALLDPLIGAVGVLLGAGLKPE